MSIASAPGGFFLDNIYENQNEWAAGENIEEINNNLKGISALNKRIEQRVDDIKEVVNE